MSWNDELIKSAEQGNLAKVKECLTNGADVNVNDDDGKTAIDVAKNYEVRAFLEKNKN